MPVNCGVRCDGPWPSVFAICCELISFGEIDSAVPAFDCSWNIESKNVPLHD